MRRILVVVTAVIMLVSLNACAVKNVTRYAYAGDSAFYLEEFNFFLAQAMGSASQAAQNNSQSLNTPEDWQTVKIGDKTADEFVKDEAVYSMKQTLVLAAKAREQGEEFTKEDEATLSQQKQSMIDSYGGRFSYEQYFAELGFSLAAVENVIRETIYSQKANEYLQDPSAPDTDETETATETDAPNFYDEIKVTDEDVAAQYKKDYVLAKHILFLSSPSDPSVADAEMAPEELAADAKTKAEDIVTQLENGADFDTLMTKHSQDLDAEGNLNGATGYIFTKGEMVPEFEEAAFALKEGEYTKEPVQTDYGYHIILRLPLPTSGEEYENTAETIKSKLQTEKMDQLIEKWANALGFKLNEKAVKNAKLNIPKAAQQGSQQGAQQGMPQDFPEG